MHDRSLIGSNLGRCDRLRPFAVVAALAILLAPTAASVVGQLGGSQRAWIQTAQMTPANTDQPDWAGSTSYDGLMFGSKVALDGALMAVGTVFDRCDMGTWVSVFEQDAQGSWVHTANLVPDDGVFAELEDSDCTAFGKSIAVDEDAGRIAVGNPAYHADGERSAGAAYLFERGADGAWSQTAKFIGPVDGDENDWPTDANHGPFFGDAVALDGGILAIGAPDDVLGAGKAHGSAFLYEQSSGGEWSLVEKLTAPGTPADTHFGAELELANGSLLASAIGLQSPPTTFVFDRTTEGWSKSAELTAPEPTLAGNEGTAFGASLALSESGGTAVVGDIFNDEVAHVNLAVADPSWNPGRAYVFEKTAQGWERTAELANPDPAMIPFVDDNEWFADAVGIHGDTIVVGAPHDVPQNTGAIYIFEEVQKDWRLAGEFQGQDTSRGDYFGETVAVAKDMVLTGAPFDDNRRDGTPAPLDDEGGLPYFGNDEGEAAGSVYVFERAEAMDS